MRIEVSEKKIMKTMNVYHKINRKYPKEMQEALEIGKEYHEAGLVPFYVYDQITGKFIITSQENFDNEGN
jgi:hypothetical protein